MLIGNGNILKPHASATAPEANRRKYGAKELTITEMDGNMRWLNKFRSPKCCN